MPMYMTRFQWRLVYMGNTSNQTNRILLGCVNDRRTRLCLSIETIELFRFEEKNYLTAVFPLITYVSRIFNFSPSDESITYHYITLVQVLIFNWTLK